MTAPFRLLSHKQPASALKNSIYIRLSLILLLFPLSFSFVYAQTVNKEWDKRFGGSGSDALRCLQQTTDGGYILGGYSLSGISGDKSEDTIGRFDYWIVKISSTGVKEWDKRFGGSEPDFLSSLQQTSDGGYILGGYTRSDAGGDKSDVSRGGTDYWVIKISSTGAKEWDKTFGGSKGDVLASLQQTTDGGYILGGPAYSDISGDKSEDSRGSEDYWIVKISSTGVKEWDKTFGGDSMDHLFSLQQTTDGGYILGGFTQSGISGDKSEDSRGGEDFWVVKVNSTGVKEWDRRFGGNGYERLHSLQQTTDGGYILGGYSNSDISGDKSENSRGNLDYWVVKISSNGVKEWDKTFGGNGADRITSLQQTTDGGYILGGYTDSGAGNDKSEPSRGNTDYWIIKISSTGIKEWDKTFGGNDEDGLESLEQTTDGGYIMGGFSRSGISGDRSEDSRGNADYWVIKTSAPTLHTASLNKNAGKIRMNSYPNPVTDGKLQISFRNLDNGVYHLTLYNAAGQKAATKQIVGNNGSCIIQMNMETLAAGIYHLSLTNGKGERVAEEKLLKQ